MTTNTMPQTRAGLRRLKQRLDKATHGYELLCDKREDLARRIKEVSEQRRDLCERVKKSVSRAKEALSETMTLMPPEVISQALLYPRRRRNDLYDAVIDELIPGGAEIFGLLPDTGTSEELYPYGFAQTCGGLDEALDALSEVYGDIPELARQKEIIYQLEDELRRVILRVDLLERVTIPQLREDIRRLTRRLAEADRSAGVRFFLNVPIILAGLIITTFLGACSQTNEIIPEETDDRLSIVATIFAPYDFAREIAGDFAEITMLLPPGSETHSFEPTPQDIIKIQSCGVFIYVGGESEEWVSELLSSIDTGKMEIVTLLDCVTTVEEELVEGMQEEHSHDENGHAHEHNESRPDEHVWTSPKNAKLIAARISEALCRADSANARSYKENEQTFLGELDKLDGAFEDVVRTSARKTVIFGDRFPFRYLTDAYGLEYFAAFPGCSAETEASSRTITFLIEKVRDEKIPVIFHAELSSTKMAETISEDTGAKVLLLHACHNISRDDFAANVSYLELMTRNVSALKEALS